MGWSLTGNQVAALSGWPDTAAPSWVAMKPPLAVGTGTPL